MRRRDAGDAVGEVAARAADRGDLQVLGVRVVHLAVARDDLALDAASESSSGSSVSAVHARDERAQVALDDEVRAVLLERLDRRRARPAPTRVFSTARTLLPVMSGFCSEPESANSFSMIFWVSTNHVWSWPVRHDVLERRRACRSRGTAAPAGGCRSRRATATRGRAGCGSRAWLQIGSQLRMPST